MLPRFTGQYPDQRRDQARVCQNAERAQLGAAEASRHVLCFGDRNYAISAARLPHRTTSAINHCAASFAFGELDIHTLKAPSDISRGTGTRKGRGGMDGAA